MDWKVLALWAVIGIIAGWLASMVVGGGGLIRYLLTGLAGAFVGGFLARQLNISLNTGSSLIDELIVATIGAIIVVLIARILA